MGSPRWFETPVSEIGVHLDSTALAAALRDRSSRTSTHLGEWSLFTAQDGGGIRVFDGRDATLTAACVARSKYVPKVSRIPWNPSWRPPSGSDGGCVVVDPRNGRRWGVWMPVWRLGVLWVGNAWLVTEPAEVRGKVRDGAPADMRTYRGNHPASNGAGVIPRPVTQAELDAGRITHALSAYVSSWTFGRDLVWCPAGKVENSGIADPSCGGLRFSWRFDDRDLDGPLGRLAPEHRWGVDVIAKAIREFGATVDMTGPNAGIVCADVDLPRDGLAEIIDRVEWVVHEPPVGWRSGARIGTGPGWYDDIRYET